MYTSSKLNLPQNIKLMLIP